MTGLVVLAAGGSTRLGRPKQLLVHEGVSLVRRAATCALDSGLGPVFLVLGAEADGVADAVAGLEVRPVVHEAWRSGQAGSVAAGVAAAAAAGCDAVLLIPCDLPRLTAGVLLDLSKACKSSGLPIAACRYDRVLGAPALFRSELFDELRSLQGDAGAKALIRRDLARVATVDWDGGAFDVDTAEDADSLDGSGAGA
ncbi:hypothetical protein ABI59_12565 [Acidobacteria bacterium Mor1]|nr:hypothetical protein ABI59_12565 [Acidobacteria bacterium Mor1]